jgi:hypothetical protein
LREASAGRLCSLSEENELRIDGILSKEEALKRDCFEDFLDNRFCNGEPFFEINLDPIAFPESFDSLSPFCWDAIALLVSRDDTGEVTWSTSSKYLLLLGDGDLDDGVIIHDFRAKLANDPGTPRAFGSGVPCFPNFEVVFDSYDVSPMVFSDECLNFDIVILGAEDFAVFCWSTLSSSGNPWWAGVTLDEESENECRSYSPGKAARIFSDKFRFRGEVNGSFGVMPLTKGRYVWLAERGIEAPSPGDTSVDDESRG